MLIAALCLNELLLLLVLLCLPTHLVQTIIFFSIYYDAHVTFALQENIFNDSRLMGRVEEKHKQVIMIPLTAVVGNKTNVAKF